MAANSSRNLAQIRLYLLGAVLLLWFFIICARLVYLQIFRYGDFEQRAQHQQQRTIEMSPKRGVIYDRSGHELAMSINVDSGFAVPGEIPDLASTISLISRITREDPREVLARCKASRSFCWVALAWSIPAYPAALTRRKPWIPHTRRLGFHTRPVKVP